MRRSFLDSVLRGAEALAARDGVGTLPDPALVGRFAAGRDPAAFAVLVRRHGPLVWAVCRNLLPADADAEDAFQATFLALVRSAGSIRRTEALAGWLHGVAYRVAVKARRAAVRRKQREAKAAVPEPSSPVPDAAWDELQAAVHEEVCKLPDKLRLPFVLCGLQGRSQKEAAAVLGWKVGTVSGRLSEARRTLLDRLARRGVPAGVAAGAAVLGGVAGHAAVPVSLSLRVQKVAGTPAAVPSNILSLARGVTPMPLTRTKLLAAGLVAAGLLTTSVGLLSRADAQAPPADPNAERLRAYYDALRVAQTPRDRWEYRFVPVDKPLSTADLQKVLISADQEGWTYCGSQDLIHQKTDKATPHMVFKRPRAGGVAATDADLLKFAEAAKRAEAAARDDALRQRADAIEYLRRAEVEKSKRLADDRTGAEKAARDAADRAKAFEARAREDLEKAVRQAEEERDSARAATDRAIREQEAARIKELEAIRTKYEELLRELQAKSRATSSPPAKKPEPQAKEPQASNPYQRGGEKSNTVLVRLAHVNGRAAADTLAKLLPAAKVEIDQSTNSLVLAGPADVVAEARLLLENGIDVPSPAGKPGAAKSEYVAIHLKSASADEMAKVMEELFGGKGPRFVAIPTSNTLLVYGTPADLDDVKKLASQLDERAGPAK